MNMVSFSLSFKVSPFSTITAGRYRHSQASPGCSRHSVRHICWYYIFADTTPKGLLKTDIPEGTPRNGVPERAPRNSAPEGASRNGVLERAPSVEGMSE